MKKILITAISLLITVTIIQVPISSVSGNNMASGYEGDYPYNPSNEVVTEALNFLNIKQLDDGSIGGFAVSAWASMAISAADQDPHTWDNLVNYLRQKSNLIDPNKATDWERQTLAIVACDENPKDFAGINFITKIISFYDGEQIGDYANLYDDFFGVLALISGGISKDSYIIKNVIDFIKSKQDSDGGWGDVDSTSVAIMALIASGENPNSEVINNALIFIKTTQADSGGFQSWGNANAASTSWAIQAIVATGQDPTSSGWMKNDNSPVDFLLSLQQEDGSFNWATGQSMNPEWMTSYVIPALLGKPYPVKIHESNDNNPPDKPTKPSGPTSGVTGTSYTYSTSAVDPDIDLLQYRFDWDANEGHDYSVWTTLDESGHMGSLSHTWNNAGTYEIKAQAKDEYGEISSWSSSIIVNINKKSVNIVDEWTGSIRIEGKDDTVWDGTVTVGETYFYAKNVDTGEIEEYHISFPSVLGALVEASDIAGFSYLIEYWPSWNAFLVKTIDGDSDWWHYWVDYELPMVGAGDYELTEEDNEILFGYLESWEAHALKIFVDKFEVKKNEEFTVSVFDENDICVEGATVYVGLETYITDENGNVTVSYDESGTLNIYSEKEGFVRSEKLSIKVKKNVMITKPFTNSFYLMNLKLLNNLKKTWIIGPIIIEVEASDEIEKVDFYINDKLICTDDERPFEYRLNERAFLKHNKITIKSYSIETFNSENLINNLIKILEKFRSLNDKNELRTCFDILKDYINNFEKTGFKEEDTDTKEVIMINLFPNLHEKLR
jgi:hypothetical protein